MLLVCVRTQSGCSLQVNQELSRSSSSEDTQEATASHDLSGNISPEDDIHVVDNSLSTPSQEWQEAAFILYIKEKHVITQAAIDTILPLNVLQLYLHVIESYWALIRKL